MTAIEKLDLLYEKSLDSEISSSEIEDLREHLHKIVEACEDMLTSPKIVMCKDREWKFKRLRKLAEEEIAVLGHSDVLCHYALMRELMKDIVEYARRGFVEKSEIYS